MTHVFLLLCLLAGDLQYQDSLLLNPSFEEDGDRDTHPDGWEPHAFDSPARLEWDDSVSRSGQRSLKVSDSFPAGDQRDWKRCTGRWVSVPRPIEAGTEYKLEVWVKTEGVSGQAYAHLAWQRGTKWLNEIATARVSGASDWQKLTVSAVAPAEADTVVVSMNLTRSKGTVWFDDVSLSGKSDVLPEVKYVFNDTGDWFPFEFPDDDINLDAIDLTSLLDVPSGKRGFVGVRPDGHFYFQDGSRARFFGTNLGGADVAPPKEQSRVLAARFAKYGANMIRLHSIDGSYTGVIDYARGNSRHFVPEALDRMDYLIAELKKHGIYIYLDLLDYRMFRDADGVKEGDQFTHNWAGSMKGASIFDERMIELQKEFATKLLTHRNPYTGLRYVDDPAIAVVETTNENGVFYFLLNGDLSRPYYREQLRLRWNGWLKSRYGDQAKLTLAWSANDVGPELTASFSHQPAFHKLVSRIGFGYDILAGYVAEKLNLPIVRFELGEFNDFCIDMSKSRSVFGFDPECDIFRIVDDALQFRKDGKTRSDCPDPGGRLGIAESMQSLHKSVAPVAELGVEIVDSIDELLQRVDVRFR